MWYICIVVHFCLPWLSNVCQSLPNPRDKSLAGSPDPFNLAFCCTLLLAATAECVLLV